MKVSKFLKNNNCKDHNTHLIFSATAFTGTFLLLHRHYLIVCYYCVLS